ncbi:MAG: hypothetical protein ACFFD4_16740 [Candidatus Odinarchaeota archaeon]
MDLDGIVIMTSDSGMPLFSKLEIIDEVLFSGLLTAIRSFSKELHLGGVSSFTTDDNKTIYLVSRSQVLVAVIASNEIEFNKVYSLCYSIGEAFESQYDLKSENTVSVNVNKFKAFSTTLEKLLTKKTVPFIIKTAEFAQKEFGGKLSIQPVLKNNNREDIKIDLLLDRGEKKRVKLMGKLATKMIKAFSEDVTFVKVIEGTAGRGEVMDFLDSLKTFGKLRTDKEHPEIYPYFPARAVVIAHDYSPTVFEQLRDLHRHKKKACIPGTHIAPDAAMHGSPAAVKCFVELWKWYDDRYPERIFN